MNKIFTLIICICAFFSSLHANRNSSAPYISGDTFRTFCDFSYDELTKSFNPADVQYGNTIFVKSDYFEEFFTRVHPRINNPYIVVSHNSDHPAPGPCAAYLNDPKLIAWFAQNVEYSHPKLHSIPIGVANRCWPHGNIDILNRVTPLKDKLVRNIPLYRNFDINNGYAERSYVASLFANEPYCIFSPVKDYASYLMDVAQSKFVLSPRGNGLDCHRTWEVLLMGAIPIVKTSTLDPMYDDMPVLIINEWTEINAKFLEMKYKEMKSKSYRNEKIYSDYWLNLIRSYQGK